MCRLKTHFFAKCWQDVLSTLEIFFENPHHWACSFDSTVKMKQCYCYYFATALSQGVFYCIYLSLYILCMLALLTCTVRQINFISWIRCKVQCFSLIKSAPLTLTVTMPALSFYQSINQNVFIQRHEWHKNRHDHHWLHSPPVVATALYVGWSVASWSASAAVMSRSTGNLFQPGFGGRRPCECFYSGIG